MGVHIIININGDCRINTSAPIAALGIPVGNSYQIVCDTEDPIFIHKGRGGGRKLIWCNSIRNSYLIPSCGVCCESELETCNTMFAEVRALAYSPYKYNNKSCLYHQKQNKTKQNSGLHVRVRLQYYHYYLHDQTCRDLPKATPWYGILGSIAVQMRLFVCLFVCLSVCMFVCLSVCLSEALKTFRRSFKNIYM